ncbi:MAG: hypothetical protein QOJ50_1766 [Cryptosporangiaceae bacterium]|nr:hypothetical protein [Cryptosporangiaceae bacterium]
MSDLDLGIPFQDAPPRGGRPRHRRRREGGRSVGAFIVMLLVFGLIAGGGWYGYKKVKGFLTPEDYPGPGTGSVTIQVEQGDSSGAIANTLFKADVVKSAKAFTEAANNDQRSLSLQPGTYVLRKQMKATAALALMLDPKSKDVNTFLITEGLTVKEILAKISKQTKIPQADLDKAASDPAGLGVPDWARSAPGKPLVLEGFLFPAKYEFGPKDTAKSLLSQMVAQTNKIMTDDGFIAAAAAIHRTPFELLTVASLVEGEAKAADFGKLSRVVYNRLGHTDFLKYLQFDSTTQYWLIKTGVGRKKHLTNAELKNPANDYSTALDMHPGLPPTPISNPGKAALEAAAHPEAGDWTYFVVTSQDGRSSFTSSYAQHLKNVQKCKDIGVC